MKKLVLVCGLIAALCGISCNRDPRFLSAQFVKSGNNYFNKGKYKEAALMYKNALQKDQLNGDAHYRLALATLKQGDPGGAVPSLRRAIGLLKDSDPQKMQAKIKLAEIYAAGLELELLRPGRRPLEDTSEFFVKIKEASDELLKQDPQSADGHYLKGAFLLTQSMNASKKLDREQSKEKLQQAILELRQADRLKPLDRDHLGLLARCLIYNGQLDEAEKVYQQMIAKDKTFLPSYRALLSLYVLRNKPAEAEALWKTAIENNPKQYELLQELASYYVGRNRPADAARVIQELKSHAKDFPAAYELAGRFYVQTNRPEEAIREYQEGMRANPKEKVTYQKHIVEVLMAQGKKADAKRINDSILKDNPNDGDAKALDGVLSLDQGDVPKAIADLQVAVARSPENPVARTNLARALIRRASSGDLEQARQQLSEAIRLRPNYLQAQLLLAELQRARGDFDQAAKTAETILQYDPNSLTAVLIRSAALMGLKRFDEARRDLLELLKRDPNSPDAYFQLGALYMEQKKYKEAEDAFRKCYQLNPANARGLMGLAENFLAQNQPERAIQVLQAEVQKNPDRIEVRQSLGNTYVRARQFDKAINEYQTILAKLGGDKAKIAEVNEALAQTYHLKGDLKSSVASWQKARDIYPNNSFILINLGIVLEADGRAQEAKDAYEQAMKLDPENPVLLNNLAYLIAERFNDLDKALSLAQRARQKLPNQPEVADTIGWIYLKKNLSDNAIDIFQAIVNNQPNFSTYRFHLAKALDQKGDKVRALKELQLALKSNPSKQEEEQIKALIQKLENRG